MRTRRRILRIWHRRIGMLSSILLLWIAGTGLMLNHTALLGLQGATGYGRLAQWMGVDVACDGRAWTLAERLLVSCENGAFLGAVHLAELTTIRSAAVADGWLLLQGPERLWVLTPEGQTVDVLELPKAGGLLLQNGTDVVYGGEHQHWKLNTDELLWQAWSGALQAFAEPDSQQLDATRLTDVERHASGVALNWSKLLQDLHTGRVLRGAGSFLLDVAGISLVLLALLGIAIDLRRAHVYRSRGDN